MCLISVQAQYIPLDFAWNLDWNHKQNLKSLNRSICYQNRLPIKKLGQSARAKIFTWHIYGLG